MLADTDTELEPMMRQALLVGDDSEIAALVQLHLRDIRCAADIAGLGRDALTLSDRNRYDLVILDLMLPDLDGLTVDLPARAFETPIGTLETGCPNETRGGGPAA